MNRKEFITVAKQTVKEFDKDDVTQLAASLTYYAFFSIFPLLLLAVTLASLILSRDEAVKFIFENVAQAAPGSSAMLSDAVDKAFENRDSAGWLAAIGLLTLAFSASSAFGTLDKALNRAWGSEKVPSFIAGKLASFVMMLAAAGLLIVSLAISTALTYTRSFTTSVIGEAPGSQVFWQFATIALSLGLVFLVFLLMYRFIPRSDVRIRDAWLGALLAAVAWVILKELFALYLGSQFANYNAVYGTMGTVIALLTWIYFSSLVILAGAEFASETQRVRRLRAEVTGGAIPDENKSPWFS